MKFATEPPRTGQQFIVNWFDDYEAKSAIVQFSKELDSFLIWSWAVGDFVPLSPLKELTYFNDKLIILER